MKTSLERTVEFEKDQFDTLHSVQCSEHHVWIERWIAEHERENVSLGWDEWDAIVAEVERYRKLQAQSEAA